MGLIFYKKILFQTKHSTGDIQRIFSDVINNPGKNEEIRKLLANNWYVRINSEGNRFQVALGQIAAWHERSGLHSVLKGKIRENKNKLGTLISMVIRPSDEYIVLLSFVFAALVAALVYAISNNITGLMIISSILIFGWYIGFLIIFNSQIRIYRRIIDRCFN